MESSPGDAALNCTDGPAACLTFFHAHTFNCSLLLSSLWRDAPLLVYSWGILASLLPFVSRNRDTTILSARCLSCSYHYSNPF
jgi:hypothetical protein